MPVVLDQEGQVSIRDDDGGNLSRNALKQLMHRDEFGDGIVLYSGTAI